MGSSNKQLLFIFLIPLIILAVDSSSAAQLDIWAEECIDSYGNYTSNSTYKANLDALLTNISTTNIPYGFYNFSSGQDSDQVNAIGLCRGDVVNVSDCHSCLNSLMSNITKSCPAQMEAIGWAEKCMFRYSARSILGGVWSNHPMYDLDTGVDFAGDVNQFSSVVEDLLMSLPNKTADGDSTLKFATGEANVSSSQKVYALMQCTPDLIPSDCLGCLYWGMYYVLHSDRGLTGIRILLPSCSIRYEMHKFYSSSPQRAATPSSPARSGKRTENAKIIIIVISVGLAFLFLVVIFLVCCCLRQKAKYYQMGSNLADLDESASFETLQRDFSTIRVATQNFSEHNLLGRGGFGKVYKGILSGKEIAVKRLETGSRHTDEDFKNEVKIAAKLQHTNLAELVGFCLEGEERLLLFEFVSNGSLERFIFDDERRVQLDWGKRFIIIEGIAQGLQYLHKYSRNKIIHRDLKPENVLLDENLRPKITDFGTARLFPDDATHKCTERRAGTRGYMAPEYALKSEFSSRSDVYSFGVLVLEIVAGRRNILSPNSDQETLINMAWKNWRNNTALDLADSKIESRSSPSQMERCIHIALLCVQESAASRPEMSRVLHMLGGESSLESPSRPPFVFSSSDSPIDVDAMLRSRSSTPNSSAIDVTRPR